MILKIQIKLYETFKTVFFIYVRSLKLKKKSVVVYHFKFKRNRFKEETVNIDDIPIKERERERDESIYLHVYFSGFPLSVCIRTSDFPFIVSMGLITCTSRVLSNSTCSNFPVQHLPIKFMCHIRTDNTYILFYKSNTWFFVIY